MKSQIRALLFSCFAIGASSAHALALPSGPCDGVTNCIQYTDFSVYSLPLLGIDVNSTYGQNQTSIIVGINNGQSSNGALIDPAYNTPSQNTASTFTNMTTDVGEKKADLSFGEGDGNGWDASVSSLKASLGSSSLVAFFAFNETGQNVLDGSDLLIWVHAQLRNTKDNTFTDFWLQDTGSTKAMDPQFVSTGGSTEPWVYVHAGICADASGFTGYPDANGKCAKGTYKDQANLGQNNAAFAVYSERLDQELKNGNWDILHIDWKMDYLNGGGETAWIMPFDVQHNVPEPATLLLLGVAMLGMGVSKHAKKA